MMGTEKKEFDMIGFLFSAFVGVVVGGLFAIISVSYWELNPWIAFFGGFGFGFGFFYVFGDKKIVFRYWGVGLTFVVSFLLTFFAGEDPNLWHRLLSGLGVGLLFGSIALLISPVMGVPSHQSDGAVANRLNRKK